MGGVEKFTFCTTYDFHKTNSTVRNYTDFFYNKEIYLFIYFEKVPQKKY